MPPKKSCEISRALNQDNVLYLAILDLLSYDNGKQFRFNDCI
jgi:hypothetical protein